MEFDVLVVGAGPSGLATACHIRQLCLQHNLDLSVCILEKGSEIGAHILSGAIIEPRALTELFPDWKNSGAPLQTEVSEEQVRFLYSATGSFRLPEFLLPPGLQNKGNYVASLANLCRWLGEQAELLGVEILTGFAAAEILYGNDGRVAGIATGDLGVDRDGNSKDSFEAGYELRAAYTVFAEGCRGHLGKQLIRKFSLDRNCGPQHYGIGIKELWEIPAGHHCPGSIVHGLGWPLGFGTTTGGSFLYHLENNQVSVGLITDLNYSNPWLSPFDEFQRMKHHPLFSTVLKGGRRISYGARALVKGGLQALPETVFPGGLLVGDNAGYLNFSKLKGSHTAIKSGMLAAQSIVLALRENSVKPPSLLGSHREKVSQSWIYSELHRARNSAPAMHKFGTVLGAAFTFFDQAVFRGRLPFTLQDNIPDHATLKPAGNTARLSYPKPDQQISFDKASSVFVSNTNHEENQPCHLQLRDASVPIQRNLPEYAEPAQRYCPAGVYEVIEENSGSVRFQINAQNCVHCKTCDIKDPAQNINWASPEGGGGPNYPNM